MYIVHIYCTFMYCQIVVHHLCVFSVYTFLYLLCKHFTILVLLLNYC
jgi:hypothetical protein